MRTAFKHGEEEHGLGVADALMAVSPGHPESVFTFALNTSSAPLALRKGTVVGSMTELSAAAVVEAVGTMDEARAEAAGMHQTRAAAASSAQAERGLTPPRTVTADLPPPRDEDLITEEQMENLLKLPTGEWTVILAGDTDEARRRRELALAMIRNNRAVFAKESKNPSRTNWVEFEVDTGDARPVAQAARQASAAENEIISENVRNIHEREQIQPSWASNPVVVRHDGKIRFCVDFRDVNKVTRKDRHGLGNISDMQRL